MSVPDYTNKQGIRHADIVTCEGHWLKILGKANAEGGEVNLPRPSKMAAFPLSKGGINIVFKNSQLQTGKPVRLEIF